MEPFDRSKDRALAQRLLRGEESAQDELHRTLAPRLRATAAYFLGWSDPDIEDVVQHAFMIAFEKWDRYDPDRAGIYTWMNQICVYLCFKRLRSRKRLVLTLSEDLQRLAPSVEAEEADPRVGAIRAHLERLQEPCRSLVRQRVQDGKSYAALAESLAVPMGTVASRLARCLQTLRTFLNAET